MTDSLILAAVVTALCLFMAWNINRHDKKERKRREDQDD